METYDSKDVNQGDLVMVVKSYKSEYLGKVFRVKRIFKDAKGEKLLALESIKIKGGVAATMINPITGGPGPRMAQFPCQSHHVMRISGFTESTNPYVSPIHIKKDK